MSNFIVLVAKRPIPCTKYQFVLLFGNIFIYAYIFIYIYLSCIIIAYFKHSLLILSFDICSERK